MHVDPTDVRITKIVVDCAANQLDNQQTVDMLYTYYIQNAYTAYTVVYSRDLFE